MTYRTGMTDAELREMNGQGWSPAELAIHFACHPVAVERRLTKLGLEPQPGRGKVSQRLVNNCAPETVLNTVSPAI